MYNLLTKNGQLFAFGLGALIVVITVVSILTGIPDDFGTLARPDQFKTSAFNFGIYAFFGLVAIALILMVGFGLFQVFADLKGSMKGLIGLGAIIIVFFITKSMASPDVTGPIGDTLTKFNVSGGTSQIIGGAITTTLLLLGATVVVFILSEVRNFFK